MSGRHRLAAGLALALLGSAAGAVVPKPAASTVEAAVLARPVLKGEQISPADFTAKAMPVAAARGGLSPEEAAGREALRNLAEGSLVRPTDLGRPQLVHRGEPVKLVLRSGGLTISASGRALGGGSAGEPVRVFSLATNRTLDGTIEGSGIVRIQAP